MAPPPREERAKRFVIKEVLGAGFVSLAVIAVVFSIIGAYYCLRIVKLMYLDDPDDISPIVCGQNTRVVLSFNGLAVPVLGLMPGS
ncbi:MAG: hypothetical protein ACHBNF_20510 [Chromatiales bacterium]